jgi:hypothetical protein
VLSGTVLIQSWKDAYAATRARDEYVLIRAGDNIIVANRLPEVRQISRVVLHRLNNLSERDADWVVRAEGPKFSATLNLLGLC